MGSLNNAITHKNSLTKHFSSFISSKNFYFQYIRQYLLISQKKCVLRNQLFLNYYNTAQKNTEPHQQFCVKFLTALSPQMPDVFSGLSLNYQIRCNPATGLRHILLCTDCCVLRLITRRHRLQWQLWPW